MAKGHKVSTKQNLLTSFSRIHFNWMGWNVIWWWSTSCWTSWFYFERVICNGIIDCRFADCIKNINFGTHLDIYKLTGFKHSNSYDDGCYRTLHSDSSLDDLDLDSKLQWCEKVETSGSIISQSERWIWVKFGMLFRHFVLINLILSVLIIMQGRAPYLVDSVLRNKTKLTKTNQHPVAFGFIWTFTEGFVANLVQL